MSLRRLILAIIIISASIASYLLLQQQEKIDVVKIILYGNVDIREAQLAFNSSEHIDKLLVQEGDHVKQGQLLATLHTELLEAELLQVQAQLITSQQTLAKLEAGYRKEEINKARAVYNAAKAKKKAASDTFNRLKPLIKENLVSS